MRALNFWPGLAICSALFIATACGTPQEEPGLPPDAKSLAGGEQPYDSGNDSTLSVSDSSTWSDEAITRYHVSRLDSVVIYCWCLENGQSNCQTWAAVKPEELCDPEKKLYTMKGQQAASLLGLINSAETRRNVFGIPDARLVLQCFTGDSVFLLTYRTLEERTLVIDQNRELHCRQPVLDWIKETMGVSEIKCPE